MKQCTVDQCPNKALRRGYCPKHYQRWRRHGDPNIVLTIRNNTENVSGQRLIKTVQLFILNWDNVGFGLVQSF